MTQQRVDPLRGCRWQSTFPVPASTVTTNVCCGFAFSTCQAAGGESSVFQCAGAFQDRRLWQMACENFHKGVHTVKLVWRPGKTCFKQAHM